MSIYSVWRASVSSDHPELDAVTIDAERPLEAARSKALDDYRSAIITQFCWETYAVRDEMGCVTEHHLTIINPGSECVAREDNYEQCSSCGHRRRVTRSQ